MEEGQQQQQQHEENECRERHGHHAHPPTTTTTPAPLPHLQVWWVCSPFFVSLPCANDVVQMMVEGASPLWMLVAAAQSPVHSRTADVKQGATAPPHG